MPVSLPSFFRFTKPLLMLVAAALLLSGCRLEVKVSEGGSVSSASGNYDCDAGSRCVFEVKEPPFNETFTAVPASGFRFGGWRRSDRHLCGAETTETCTLSTDGAEDTEILQSILASDETFFVEPIFLENTTVPKVIGTQRYKVDVSNLANAGLDLTGASLSSIFGTEQLDENNIARVLVPRTADFIVFFLDLADEVSIPIVRDRTNEGPLKWDDVTLGFLYMQPNVYGLDHNTRDAIMRAIADSPDYADLREQVRLATLENPGFLLNDRAIASQQAEIQQLAIQFIGQLNPISGSAFGDPEFAGEDIAYYYSALRSGALNRNEYREIYAWYTATTLASILLRDEIGVAPAGYAGDTTLPHLDQTSSQVSRGQGEYISRNPRYAFYNYFLDNIYQGLLSARQGAFPGVNGGGPWQSPVKAYQPLEVGDYVAQFNSGVLDAGLGGTDQDAYVANLVNVTCQLVDSFSRCNLSPDEIIGSLDGFQGLDTLVAVLGDFGRVLAGGTGTTTRQEVFLRLMRQNPELLGTVVQFGVEIQDSDLRSTIRKVERYLVTGRTMAATAYLNDLWTPVVFELGEMKHAVDVCPIMTSQGILTDPEQVLELTGRKIVCKEDLAPEARLRVASSSPTGVIREVSPGIYELSQAASVEFYAGDSTDDRTPTRELFFKYQLISVDTNSVIYETLYTPNTSQIWTFDQEGRFAMRVLVRDNGGNVDLASNEVNANYSSMAFTQPTENTASLNAPVQFVVSLSAPNVFTTVTLIGNNVVLETKSVPSNSQSVEFTFDPSSFYLVDGSVVNFKAEGTRANSSTSSTLKTLTFVDDSTTPPVPPPGGTGNYTTAIQSTYWEAPSSGSAPTQREESSTVNGSLGAFETGQGCTTSGVNRLVVEFQQGDVQTLQRLKLVTGENFTGAGTYSLLPLTAPDTFNGGPLASDAATNRCDAMVDTPNASFEGLMTVYSHSVTPEGNAQNVSLRARFEGLCTTAPFDINGSTVTNTSNLQGETSEIRYQIVNGQCGTPPSN